MSLSKLYLFTNRCTGESY